MFSFVSFQMWMVQQSKSVLGGRLGPKHGAKYAVFKDIQGCFFWGASLPPTESRMRNEALIMGYINPLLSIIIIVICCKRYLISKLLVLAVLCNSWGSSGSSRAAGTSLWFFASSTTIPDKPPEREGGWGEWAGGASEPMNSD